LFFIIRFVSPAELKKKLKDSATKNPSVSQMTTLPVSTTSTATALLTVWRDAFGIPAHVVATTETITAMLLRRLNYKPVVFTVLDGKRWTTPDEGEDIIRGCDDDEERYVSTSVLKALLLLNPPGEEDGVRIGSTSVDVPDKPGEDRILRDTEKTVEDR